jgi:LysR family transcriptional regulator, glycine cleavage system transcriptional activator
LNPEIARLPSLVALRAFVVVGDTLSVRQAGELLHTDHASVSRHISNLESTVGGALLEKSGRGVALTELGKKYHRKLKRAFDILCEATHETRAARPSVLSISAPPGLAHEVLLPAIPRLAEALDGWKINLFTELSSTVARTEDAIIHAYLRYGSLDALPSDMIQVAITKPDLFPVASPAFLAKYPSVTTVEEMLELPFMCSDTTGLWERWARHAGVNYQFSMRGVEMPNTHLALQAAALGQGIALGNSILAAKAIHRGELVQVLDKRIALDDYYLVCTKRDWERSPIRELHQWVERELLAFVMVEGSDQYLGN